MTPDKSVWRRTLGHYPTGITIITSVDNERAPVGMVVGTFTSVSEQPPLVGFLPQRTSRTLALIEQAGRFRASVLGATHERFCRDFFTALPEQRFAHGRWEPDQFGIPRLKDAVAWFDATVHDVLPAGDHVMVLGEVTDLGLGPSANDVPLVFHRGGYGTFSTPSTGIEFGDFGGKLRLANSVAGQLEQLTMELGADSALVTVVDDDVVALSSGTTRSAYVGTSFPFAAPLDPGFAAWCEPAQRAGWLTRGRELVEEFDEQLVSDVVDLARHHGYAISFGYTLNEEFQRLLSTPDGARAAFAGLWESTSHAFDAYRHDREPHTHASALQVPVFGADGHIAFELLVGSFDVRSDPERFRWIVETAADHAARLTRALGGRAPASYFLRT